MLSFYLISSQDRNRTCYLPPIHGASTIPPPDYLILSFTLIGIPYIHNHNEHSFLQDLMLELSQDYYPITLYYIRGMQFHSVVVYSYLSNFDEPTRLQHCVHLMFLMVHSYIYLFLQSGQDSNLYYQPVTPQVIMPLVVVGLTCSV